jgi:hypothetical protein
MVKNDSEDHPGVNYSKTGGMKNGSGRKSE